MVTTRLSLVKKCIIILIAIICAQFLLTTFGCIIANQFFLNQENLDRMDQDKIAMTAYCTPLSNFWLLNWFKKGVISQPQQLALLQQTQQQQTQQQPQQPQQQTPQQLEQQLLQLLQQQPQQQQQTQPQQQTQQQLELLLQQQQPQQQTPQPRSSVLVSIVDLEARYAQHKLHNVQSSFHPFKYLVEPTVCTAKTQKKMLLYVTMSQNNLQTRKAIRETWAIETKKNDIEVVFIMGRSKDANNETFTNDIIEAKSENQQFGDILMGNYIDSWDNLILKWWSSKHYHYAHCGQIPLMASIDSDIFIFGDRLRQYIDQNTNILENYVGCVILGGQPIIRDKLSRYYVNPEQWPEEMFDNYCSGVMIMASTKTCQKIADAVPNLGINYIASFRIFDVITGPIAAAAKVELRSINGIFPWIPVNDICYQAMFALHSVKGFQMVNFSKYRQACCSLNVPNYCPFNGTVPAINIPPTVK